MTRNVLTSKQVAKRLGVQVETVYAYVSRGVLDPGLGAVSGPLHGKAALAVHRLFERADESSPELALAHAPDGAPVAAGFGHPVYRGRDPRAAYLLTALAPLMKRRPTTAATAARIRLPTPANTCPFFT
ncbi:MAG: citrate synthase [Polyangiaceae bacterium]|jgi:hypothetical protein